MILMKSELRPWRTLSEEKLLSCLPWFSVKKQCVQLPNGQIVLDYHHIEMPNTTQVIVTDDKDRALFLRQFKQGVEKVCLTLPGGAVNENEDPRVAARRELLEETGIEANQWQQIATHANHGSYGCGRETIFIASGDLKIVSEPQSGDLEEMEQVWVSRADVQKMVDDGRVEIMGVLVAMLLFINHTRIKD